jgi:hypothetical protein
VNWSCPRTCRTCEQVDLCRFTPLLRAVGVQGAVTSHTTRVACEYRDLDALRAAVAALGGTCLGEGEHRIYSHDSSGIGFRLPGWRFPLVVAGGELVFDNYGGSWGDIRDLAKLEAAYVNAAAQAVAAQLGWQCRVDGDALVVDHPAGGSLRITRGEVDACGFIGAGCHAAAEDFVRAIGRASETALKPSFYEQHQQVREVDIG